MPTSLSSGTAPVSVIGLGNLGQPMARRLMDDGCLVRVGDLDPGKTAGLVTDGAAELTENHRWGPDETVALVVSDDTAVEALVSDGLLDRMARESLLMVHSTLLPSTSERVAELCRSKEIACVDAPVSGGAERARAGSLTAMVGASQEDLERARPYLTKVTAKITHVGLPGAGSAAKLANQLMLFASLSGAYEAMAVAGTYGISEQVLLDAISGSTGESWVSRHWGFYDRLDAEYDDAGVPPESRPWSKDLVQMCQAADGGGVDAPLTEFLAQHLPDQVTRHTRSGPDDSHVKGKDR